jgi:DNA helicase II / ATP-dependent DNA helicase PcrA
MPESLPFPEKLSAEQESAVRHGAGPLLVVAGPGTGKTNVLTHRVAHLIGNKQARPEEILALTFTDKAAREMEERVDRLVPYGYIETTISTFHAFGDRVLRDHSLELGLSYRGVLTPAEQLLFCSERLFEFELEHYRPLGSPTKHLQALLRLISRCKDEAITPKDYLKAARAHARAASTEEERLAAAKQLELARFYQRYQELLGREGRVDYGDQVLLTLQLFRAHPDVLREYRERYRWILVDEFQDTNKAQFGLLRLLAGESGNLTAVGDDDQSIYAFRGAALSNILQFLEVYPEAAQVTLTQNFRSTQPILDASYRLIQQNNPERLEVKTGVSKRLTATRKGGSEPEVREFATISEEADWVAEQIREKLAGEILPREIAILVRSHAAATPYAQALGAAGIAHQLSGAEALYERPEVRTLLGLLRVVADPAEDVALYHLATSEIYGAPVSETLGLLREASRSHRPLYHLLGEPGRFTGLSREGERSLARVREDVEGALERSKSLEVGQLLYQFLSDSKYLGRLARPESVEDELKVMNVARLFDRIREFQEVAQDRSTVSFVRHLEELILAGEDPRAAGGEVNDEAVQVLTVHAAKGLEFAVVYLCSMVQEIFPARNLGEGLTLPASLVGPGGADRLSEERRLAYVAMTRAERELTLSWSRDMGGKRTRKPSIFIAEAFQKATGVKGQAQTPLERIERFKPAGAPPPLSRKLAEDEPLQLSFRQIEDYRSCPRGYYLRHVLRIPTPPHHAFVYGRAVHAAIVEFYRAKLSGKLLTPEQMKEAFQTAWESEGFLSRAHEEVRYAAGERLLERFHAGHQGDGPPLFVEKEFHFPVGIDKVVGRWDFVAKVGDEVEVRDFKTSEVSDQKTADKRSKESLQLGVYALGYRNIYQETPKRLVLDFVETDLQGVSSRTEAQLAEVEAIIAEAAAGIRAANFDPSPDHPRDCICRQFENI